MQKLYARRVAGALFAALFALAIIGLPATGANTSTSALAQTGQADLPVEQTRKNIQVLKGLPESQLFLVMNSIGDALGVHCDYCHVKNGKNPATGADNWVWESDEKPKKLAGREMMKMVLDLNKTRFNGSQTITCYSCHRGSTGVARVAPLPPRDFTAAGANEHRAPLPAAEQILNKYLEAIGGKDAGTKFATMTVKGTLERSQGRNTSFEITAKGTDRYLLTLTQPQGITRQGVDGTTGWVSSNDAVRQLSSAEIAQLKRALALFAVVKVTDQPAEMTVLGAEKIGNREAYAVSVKIDSNTDRQLFFDTETGLLLRIITTAATLIAPLPQQTDFEDYRIVDGVKLPFTIRTSNVAAFDTTTRKLTEIRLNVPVDDATFRQPAPQK